MTSSRLTLELEDLAASLPAADPPPAILAALLHEAQRGPSKRHRALGEVCLLAATEPSLRPLAADVTAGEVEIPQACVG